MLRRWLARRKMRWAVREAARRDQVKRYFRWIHEFQKQDIDPPRNVGIGSYEP